MPHSHHHPHPSGEDGDRRLAFAVAVNVLLTVGQIVGGILSGSIALIADAIHNLSDAMSLVIAFAAQRIARRPSDGTMPFGYRRAETVAALVNYTTLILISLYLGYEAVWRLVDPQPVAGAIVVAVAGLALAIDLVTAFLTMRMARDSLNIRAAFLHNLADAGTSVAVILGGALVWAYDWRLVDPLLTLGISAFILWHALSEIRPVIRILMLGAPPLSPTGDVIDSIRAVEGVADVHNVYLWQIDEHSTTLQAHLVMAGPADPADVKRRVKDMLAASYAIANVTLETETPPADCDAPPMIGA